MESEQGECLDKNRRMGGGDWQPEADLPITPTLYLEDDTNQYHQGAGTIERGQWGHFLWTVDRGSNRVKSYLDGVFQGETDITNLGDISNEDLLIGQMNYVFSGDDG